METTKRVTGNIVLVLVGFVISRILVLHGADTATALASVALIVLVVSNLLKSNTAFWLTHVAGVLLIGLTFLLAVAK